MVLSSPRLPCRYNLICNGDFRSGLTGRDKGVCSKLKKCFKIIVQVLQVFSFVGLMLSGVLGAVYEIIGYAKFEQALSAIGISNGSDRALAFAYIMSFLQIATYFIKSKFFR